LPDRHEIERIIFAKEKTFILHDVQKTHQMPEELRDRWIKKLLDTGQPLDE
jgi:hypothetical protein